jgi:hypothetical protein
VEVAREQPRVRVDTLLLLNGTEPARSTGSTPLGLRRLYDSFDSWRFPHETRSLAPKDLAELAGWRVERYPIQDTQQLRERIRSLGLDGVLWLSTRLSPLAFVDLWRYGAWQWKFGGQDETEVAVLAREPSFDTVLKDVPTIEVRLTATLSNSPETILAASRRNSVRFSRRRTEDAINWRAAPLLSRAAGRLLTDGPDSEEFDAERPADSRRRGPVALSVSQTAQLFSLGSRYIGYRVANARRINQWAMAFYRDPSGAKGPAIAPGEFTELVPPRNYDWADPFPVRVGDTDWLFFEELEYARGIGHLSVAPLGRKHFMAKPEPIIVEPFHLSWPFVFQHEGEHYILPETASEGCVRLYRATRFPYEWSRDRVLLEGSTAVDPTLIQIGGRWWLFVCDLDDGKQPWGELHLYYSDSPFGPWTPHRRNPVVSDVSHARPAGRIFQQGDAWYRPAQDCSVDYGYALSLMRIDVLSPDEFRETKVTSLAPTWGPRLCGVHTLNHCEDVTLIDFRRRVWRSR